MAKVIVMPKLGLTMTEGTVSKWLKAEGDAVKEGEPLFEVETDNTASESSVPMPFMENTFSITSEPPTQVLTLMPAMVTKGWAMLRSMYPRSMSPGGSPRARA